MVKSLIETYKTLKEAGGASGGFVQAMQKKAAETGAASAAPKPVDAKAQGFPARPAASPSTSGTSTAFGGRPAPSNAINNLGRVSQRPVDKPMPMGGSIPGRQVNSTMMAARKVTSTGNPNVAGGTAPVRPAVPAPSTGAPKNRMDVVRQAQQQRKQDARISAVSRPGGTTPTQTSGPNRPPPGGFISPQAAMKAGQNFNVGSTGGVVSRPAAPGKTPTLDRTIPKSPVYPNKGMAGSPLDQTQGARPEVSRDYRLNQMRQNPPALDTKRDASLDSPNEKSPMARATNPNVGGAGGGNYKDAQTPSVVSTGNPNVAGGTAPVKPGQPVRAKKPGVVQKPNVPVKLARKPQAAGTQNNMTPAQRAQQNRRVERGNARPGEKTIGLGVNTGKVTKKVVNSKRPIGSSPLKEGMLNNKQLSEMIKTLRNKNLKEQNPKAEASSYRERQQFKPVHVSDPYNKKDQSPNDYMHRMAEGMQQSTLGPDRSKKMNVYSSTLGNLKSRRWGGNQSMDNRYESAETDLGSTETGKKGREAETVSVNPKDTTFSATDPTNKNTTTKETKEK